jgi:transcription termination factor Rho
MHKKAKAILWAARNVENGGSKHYCNCIDGNWFKMDEVILKNKGTGNMELQLDKKLQQTYLPVIDLTSSYKAWWFVIRSEDIAENVDYEKIPVR